MTPLTRHHHCVHDGQVVSEAHTHKMEKIQNLAATLTLETETPLFLVQMTSHPTQNFIFTITYSGHENDRSIPVSIKILKRKSGYKKKVKQSTQLTVQVSHFVN